MAAVIDSLTIKPDREHLAVLLQPQPAQTIFNQPLHTWRESTRRELSLPTDREIDQLVYKLYKLTAEEIKIVEEATE